jgi:hypothetical protein
MTSPPSPQPLEWFDPDELEPCRACADRHGLTIEDAGCFICFGCGYTCRVEGQTTAATPSNRLPSSLPNSRSAHSGR